MSKRHADSTPDEKAPKRRKLSDSVLVEAARNGDTTAVRVGLEKLIPDTDSKRVAFDAVHEACRGNHDECLALLLPYVETTQMGFGMLLSECIHADHTACTEVLLQHWKSVCSNVAFVPHGHKVDIDGKTPRPCPAMWADPAVCQVLIDAGVDIETKDENGRPPLLRASISGKIATVKMLVEAGAGVCATDNSGDTCLILASRFGHTETVRYLVGLKDVDVNQVHGKDGFTSLHYAGQQGPGDVVEVLIDAGADVEANQNGWSPLLLASSSGHLDIVKMLVQAGARVCITNNERRTCLSLAAYFGHTETVRYLVGLKDVDVNHAENKSCTVLHCAVQEGHRSVVQVLIDAGVDIEAKNDVGRSPLLFASSLGHLDIVKMLVEAGADVCVTDNEGDTCLMLATYCGHTETVRYLVGLKDVEVNHAENNGWTALHLTVELKLPGVVQVLIDAGADVEAQDTDGLSPLLFASSSGHLDIVKMLVEAGAVCVTNNNDATCLMLASHSGHTETVRFLAGLKDVDVNQVHEKDGFTALHCAGQQGRGDVVEVLIDAGADIEAKNDVGRSPLLFASSSGHLDIVKMLVKAGAGVCVTDNEGDTCLIFATYFGHTETVRYLVGLKDVDVNHADNNGFAPLFVAVQEGHGDVVQVLIAAGADIEAKNKVGRSPLLLASSLGNLDIVKMLVEAGAGVCVTDNEGDTCLILATYCGHTETVRYLVGLPDVDVNQQGMNHQTALHIAVHSAVDEGHRDVMQVLIDAGADIEEKDENRASPLLFASRSGHLDIVKMLVEAGAGVCVTNKNGLTCLILASARGHTETVRYLVGLKELDVNSADKSGHTALHHAVEQNRCDVVKVLIAAGVDIELKNKVGGNFPLLVASGLGHLDIVKMLVEAGADVCVTDNKGDTCLILAIQEGHADVLKVLIDAGADFEKKDSLGRSPLLLASTSGHLDIVRLLVKAGA